MPVLADLGFGGLGFRSDVKKDDSDNNHLGPAPTHEQSMMGVMSRALNNYIKTSII